jgi:L-threonylcarbamoyladenylate synthase
MKDDLSMAIATLKNGGTILYPTDTIWGIGCDATNDSAITRIFEIKDREETKQMLILVADASEIENYVQSVPDIAFDFIESASKPLSIIFQNAKNLAPSLIGLDQTIGIRVVRDEFCQELIRNFGKPIVSTSANVGGTPPPGNFSEIDQGVKEAVDYIVLWRQDDKSQSVPSEIIKFGQEGEIIKIR